MVFKVMQDCALRMTPQYWKFWLGLFLVVLVLVGRERMSAGGDLRSLARGSRRRRGMSAAGSRWRPRGLVKRFGGLRRHQRRLAQARDTARAMR